jgi:hypothetical protein
LGRKMTVCSVLKLVVAERCSLCTEYLNKITRTIVGHTVAQLVEALLYKSEGRGFDSR